MATVFGNIVHFSFFCPRARSVFLVGASARSRRRRWKMVGTREGYWLAQLELPPGPFRYRYRADGTWHTDRDEIACRDREAGWLSIVDVSDAKRAAGRKRLAVSGAVGEGRTRK